MNTGRLDLLSVALFQEGSAMEKRKLGTSGRELTAADVHALEEASSKVKLEGARYSKFHEQLVGR